MNDEIMLVEKFDASKPRSYMAFRAQWDNFEAKMTRANRSELDKFYALLRVVDGQAKNLIKNDSFLQISHQTSCLPGGGPGCPWAWGLSWVWS